MQLRTRTITLPFQVFRGSIFYSFGLFSRNERLFPFEFKRSTGVKKQSSLVHGAELMLGRVGIRGDVNGPDRKSSALRPTTPTR